MSNNYIISGFTLIELTISLIVLALLITAIAGSANLIESAKYRKIISEFNQYRFMIKEFEVRYEATPGKFNNAHSYWPSTATLADYFIDGEGGIGPVKEIYETPLVWIHLSKAELLSESFDYSDQTSGYVGKEISGIVKFAPTSSAFEGGGFMLVRGAAEPYASGTSAFSETNENVLYLAASTSMSTTLDIPIAAIKPEEAFLIDSKIDDGEVNSSEVFVGGSSGKFRTINSSSYAATFDCVNSSGNYTGNDTKGCIIGLMIY
jgi:prepilin-type N-terminal cleavage/methylation domain-containing protein